MSAEDLSDQIDDLNIVYTTTRIAAAMWIGATTLGVIVLAEGGGHGDWTGLATQIGTAFGAGTSSFLTLGVIRTGNEINSLRVIEAQQETEEILEPLNALEEKQ